MGRLWAKIRSTIKSQDMFAVPVQLSYRGAKSFNTVCGGLASIFLVLFLIAYFAFEMHQAYTKPDY